MSTPFFKISPPPITARSEQKNDFPVWLFTTEQKIHLEQCPAHLAPPTKSVGLRSGEHGLFAKRILLPDAKGGTSRSPQWLHQFYYDAETPKAAQRQV